MGPNQLTYLDSPLTQLSESCFNPLLCMNLIDQPPKPSSPPMTAWVIATTNDWCSPLIDCTTSNFLPQLLCKKKHRHPHGVDRLVNRSPLWLEVFVVQSVSLKLPFLANLLSALFICSWASASSHAMALSKYQSLMPIWVQDYMELYKTYDMYADLMENGPKVLGVIVVRYLHLKLGFMPKCTQTLWSMCKWFLCSRGYNND